MQNFGAGRLPQEPLVRRAQKEPLERCYHDSGKLAKETHCKFGVCIIWRKGYSEAGQLVDEFYIDENDWRYQWVMASEAAGRQRDVLK